MGKMKKPEEAEKPAKMINHMSYYRKIEEVERKKDILHSLIFWNIWSVCYLTFVLILSIDGYSFKLFGRCMLLTLLAISVSCWIKLYDFKKSPANRKKALIYILSMIALIFVYKITEVGVRHYALFGTNAGMIKSVLGRIFVPTGSEVIEYIVFVCICAAISVWSWFDISERLLSLPSLRERIKAKKNSKK